VNQNHVHLLPEWEKRDLILSVGSGNNRRYLNLKNMDL